MPTINLSEVETLLLVQAGEQDDARAKQIRGLERKVARLRRERQNAEARALGTVARAHPECTFGPVAPRFELAPGSKRGVLSWPDPAPAPAAPVAAPTPTTPEAILASLPIPTPSPETAKALVAAAKTRDLDLEQEVFAPGGARS